MPAPWCNRYTDAKPGKKRLIQEIYCTNGTRDGAGYTECRTNGGSDLNGKFIVCGNSIGYITSDCILLVWTQRTCK